MRLKKTRVRNDNQFEIDVEAKKGLVIVILLAFIILSFLSFFHLAGRFGFGLEKILAKFFGVGYFVFPFLLAGIVYLLVSARKKALKVIHYLAMTFFILSFYALIQLTQPLPFGPLWKSLKQAFAIASAGKGGGYIGIILNYPLVYFLGFWGGLTMLATIFIGSTLLIFNISLDDLLRGIVFLKIFFKRIAILSARLRNKIYNYLQQKKYSKYKDKKQIDQDDNQRDECRDEYNKENDPHFIQSEINNSEEDLKGEQDKIKFNKKYFLKQKIDLPIDLLQKSKEKPTSGDIINNAHIIKKTLKNFGIEVEMGQTSVGPSVTQYTLKPAEGIKLSQIITLNNDISLSLAAHPIRIEAPIPGKSLVGIEVPNKSVAKVHIRDIITSKEFKNRLSNLMISLGEDVSGKIWMTDFAKNPHLLIAGSTGSGKTICINSIIINLFYQNSPDNLRFIMVDPKRIELPVYNGIPYLLCPVITDVKKTINALKWAVSEMEKRFDILSKNKNRDIFSYRASGNIMPSIIIIIDELADLMAAAGHEIEALIIRLVQMSRAVGIYLIIATQRPSVNVITGLIKANITSRIAFSVASLMDSRTILDCGGAEKLIGRGDMLFISTEVSKPKRLQGAFISENEIKKVVNYLKDNYDEVEYDEEIVEGHGNGIDNLNNDFEEDEGLVNEAREIVVMSQQASISFLQRRMRIGYNKAARIIETLENLGVVGPADGAKQRQVLIPKETLENIENNNN
ncbi:MAG: cell division protein FtsK [Xanthomonadaceae bacterium]|nr:cell division protein FtsK [Rhodospirillaceae bacterium]NIA17579.1 cell division protein FtsK [Xanthomonadaceae bacterium]